MESFRKGCLMQAVAYIFSDMGRTRTQQYTKWLPTNSKPLNSPSNVQPHCMNDCILGSDCVDRYNLMLECWAFKPAARPTFSELCDRIYGLCALSRLHSEQITRNVLDGPQEESR